MSDFKDKEGYQASEVRRLKDQFEKGGLSRRDFMQGMVATGLTAATAMAVLTGSRDVRAETPKKGGRLTVAFSQHGPTDTLDPQLVTDSISYARGRAHQNNLVQFNDDLSLRGDLAEHWEVNSDATEFTFHLKKGVTWHDGKDFTADDVVYSMNRHLGEDSVSKAKTLVAMVDEWKKLDSHTVKASLSSANADLTSILATFHFRMVQNNADDDPEYFKKGIGTGPFTVKEFSPGVRSVSVRNPNYHREGPWLDEIEMFAITDNTARINSLEAGDVDMITDVNARAYKQINEAEGVNLYSIESGAYMDFVLMQDRSPGNNKDFVLGIKHLLNRVRMVRSLLKGQGGVGNDHPIGPAYGKDFCEDLPIREFDPEKADFHLKKSGVKQVELTGSEGIWGGMDTALMLQAEAQKLGLKIDLKKVPYDGYWGSTWMQKPFHLSNWNMRPTATIMMELAYGPEAPWNESIWKNERMGMLLTAARGETDAAKRKEMLCEMQSLIRDEAGTPLPFHSNYVDGKRDAVKGLRRVPLESLGGGEWPEYAWIDA